MTDQTKHTPGPWEYSTRFTAKATGPLQMIGPDPECRHIADIPRNGDQQRQEADARLIAAAPELLETLENVLRLTSKSRQTEDNGSVGWEQVAANRLPHIAQAARAAIAKATGREE